MRELQIIQVRGMPAHGDRDDMIDSGAHRIRIRYGKVDRLSADRADVLRCKYYFFISLILGAVFSVMVGTVSCRCHISLGTKRAGCFYTSRPLCKENQSLKEVLCTLPDTILSYLGL